MNVAIFRLQLFKPSEPFIHDQVRTLPTAKSLMVGRKLFGPAPAGIDYWAPERQSLVKTAAFVGLGLPGMMLEGLEPFAPDLIHAHFAIDALYALPARRRLKVPLITTLHGFDVTMRRADMLKSRRPALVRYALFQDRLKAEGDLFICVSEFIRQAALAAGFPADRLLQHYIGVDSQMFQPSQPEESDESGELVLLHIARLVEKKGTRYLIRAFAKSASRYPRAKLVIIGGGPLADELKALAKETGVAEKVDFLGAQPHAEVRRRVARASVLVVPSVTAESGDAEGLPIALLEAFATGVPVIGTRHGGIPEAVVDGQTGLLVEERSVDQLAEAIDVLLGEPATRRRYGAAARALLMERFDLRKQSTALESIYEKAIGAG